MLQIIADQEAESGSVLPTNILMDIVRSYSSDAKNIMPEFLSESFELLKDHRRKISSSLLDQMSNPLDPKKAMSSLEAWREAQTDIATSVMSAWLPKNKKATKSEQTGNDADTEEEEASVSDELDLLKQQMEEMQKKLESLQKKN